MVWVPEMSCDHPYAYLGFQDPYAQIQLDTTRTLSLLVSTVCGEPPKHDCSVRSCVCDRESGILARTIPKEQRKVCQWKLVRTECNLGRR